MSNHARNVLADALQLPADEVERLWDEEITRRARRAISGESTGTDAEIVFRAVANKIAPR